MEFLEGQKGQVKEEILELERLTAPDLYPRNTSYFLALGALEVAISKSLCEVSFNSTLFVGSRV